jgi:hypothetical protein
MNVNFGHTVDDYAKSRAWASLKPEQVGRFDSELKQMLEALNQVSVKKEAVLFIPHRVFAVTAQKSK